MKIKTISFQQVLAQRSTKQLVEAYNRETTHTGWASARAVYLLELVKELEKRGVDISNIYDGKRIYLKNKLSFPV